MNEITSKYKDIPKKELIKHLKEKDRGETELLSLPWVGNLGQ